MSEGSNEGKPVICPSMVVEGSESRAKDRPVLSIDCREGLHSLLNEAESSQHVRFSRLRIQFDRSRWWRRHRN